MIEIYFGKVNIQDIDSEEKQLIPFFKDRVNEFNNANSRSLKIAAYYHLQKLLEEKKVLPSFIINDYGKIYLANNELYFNISHSKDLYVLAIHSSEVGVDVEKIRADKRLKLKNRISNVNDIDIESTKMWSIKESYFKYLGTGVSTDMKNIIINEEKVILNNKIARYKNFEVETQLGTYEITVCAGTLDEIKLIEIK